MKKSTLKKTVSGTLILLLFLISSCSKNSDDPFYVKFKIDGKEKIFYQPTIGIASSGGSIISYGIFGKKKVSSDIYESMNVVITLIYMPDYIKNNIVYTPPEARLFYVDTKNINFNSIVSPEPRVEITITQSDDTVIKGIFSGDVTSTIDSVTTHHITNGEFSVSLR